jgi:hypothetical protein
MMFSRQPCALHEPNTIPPFGKPAGTLEMRLMKCPCVRTVPTGFSVRQITCCHNGNGLGAAVSAPTLRHRVHAVSTCAHDHAVVVAWPYAAARAACPSTRAPHVDRARVLDERRHVPM